MPSTFNLSSYAARVIAGISCVNELLGGAYLEIYDKGQPVDVPLTLYKRAKAAIAEYPTLCTGVTLNKREGR